MTDITDGSPHGILLGPGEGARIGSLHAQMWVKVGPELTGGVSSVIEGVIAPGNQGPIPHVHDGHDECFIMLEGRMRFRIGGGFRTASAGDVVYAGRGLEHGFANPFAHHARYAVVLTPSGYEAYFAEMAARVAELGSIPDEEWIEALMARYSTRPVPRLPDPEAAALDD
jgi:quercetin dioxygenase-like cupin family protein